MVDPSGQNEVRNIPNHHVAKLQVVIEELFLLSHFYIMPGDTVTVASYMMCFCYLLPGLKLHIYRLQLAAITGMHNTTVILGGTSGFDG